MVAAQRDEVLQWPGLRLDRGKRFLDLTVHDTKITDIGEHRWRLFDIAADPGETHDLSAQDPARKAALLREWDRYAKSVGVVLPNPPLQPTPPKDLE